MFFMYMNLNVPHCYFNRIKSNILLLFKLKSNLCNFLKCFMYFLRIFSDSSFVFLQKEKITNNINIIS